MKGAVCNGLTLFQWTCREGGAEVVQELLERNDSYTEEKTTSGLTPLHIAAEWNQPAVVKVLQATVSPSYGGAGLRCGPKRAS